MMEMLAQPQVLAFLGVFMLLGFFLFGMRVFWVLVVVALIYFLEVFSWNLDAQSANIFGSPVSLVIVFLVIPLLYGLVSYFSPEGATAVNAFEYMLCLIFGLILVGALIAWALGYA